MKKEYLLHCACKAVDFLGEQLVHQQVSLLQLLSNQLYTFSCSNCLHLLLHVTPEVLDCANLSKLSGKVYFLMLETNYNNPFFFLFDFCNFLFLFKYQVKKFFKNNTLMKQILIFVCITCKQIYS